MQNKWKIEIIIYGLILLFIGRGLFSIIRNSPNYKTIERIFWWLIAISLAVLLGAWMSKTNYYYSFPW